MSSQFLLPSRLLRSGALRRLVLSGSLLLTPAVATASDGIGIRAGLSRSPDQFGLGGQAELGPVFASSFFVPSVDVGFGDPSTVTVVNGDLRWYLLPLPETGIRIYGQAGPALVVSPDTELGLNLVGGTDIPMKSRNRYNIEARFGVGDIPDLRIVFALVFGS